MLCNLPIVERWDCQQCGTCCRGSNITLTADDLATLRAQNWDQHPLFEDQPWLVKEGWFAPTYRLARHPDGACVFLTDDNRCLIHAQHGEESKPLVCRLFPFQAVPQVKDALLTVRRSCPSAARGDGKSVEQHLASVRPLLKGQEALLAGAPLPRLTRRLRGNQTQAEQCCNILSQVVRSDRWPFVLRLVQGVTLCDLLESCVPRKLRRMTPAKFNELLDVLRQEAEARAPQWFSDRTSPESYQAVLLRQQALETLRLHPESILRGEQRSQSQLSLALQMAKGSGALPDLVPTWPKREFAELERPQGGIAPALLLPLEEYLMAMVVSQRFARFGYQSWNLLDAFRNLALQYPLARWLWRWGTSAEISVTPLIPIITALDRAHGYSGLLGRQQRRRVRLLTADGGLQRLIAWYAR